MRTLARSRLAYIDGTLSQIGDLKLERAGLMARWEGLLYVDGFHAQEDSVEHWLDQVNRHGLERSLKLLKGAFFMLLKTGDGAVHAFVDNSGMFAAYWSQRGVGQSYLALVDELGLGWPDLDKLALMELLQTGNIYSNRTHFPEIRKIGYDERFEYRPDGTVSRHIKDVPFIDSPAEHDSLIDSFKGYAQAISGIETSVDVTGGLDTRTLIAALHATDVEFELSVSGHPQHPDVLLGAEVARSVNRPFHLTTHDAASLHADLEGTVESLDGLQSHILVQHRLTQNQRDRYGRGKTLTLKGSGGELLRDFIWLQDFPRYGSKSVNIPRMHRMRMEMLRIPESLLTEEYRSHSDKAREQRINNLENYRRETNTQTYDVVYCRESLQVVASRQIGSWAHGGNCGHAPLAELFRLQHCYHQQPSKRLAGRYQKRFITDCSVELAKVQTTYGTRASSLVSDIPGDFAGLGKTYSKALTRKIAQRYLNKTPFPIIPADDPDAVKQLVSSPFSQRMLKILESRGILLPGTEVSDVPVKFLSNCVAAGYFLSRL